MFFHFTFTFIGLLKESFYPLRNNNINLILLLLTFYLNWLVILPCIVQIVEFVVMFICTEFTLLSNANCIIIEKYIIHLSMKSSFSKYFLINVFKNLTYYSNHYLSFKIFWIDVLSILGRLIIDICNIFFIPKVL